MGSRKVFASFILDGKQEMEIALPVESVREATPVSQPLKSLPSAVHFLEGILDLRGSILPVVNLKKRLKFDEADYGAEFKIAVVQNNDQQFGIMVDDIKDVLWVEKSEIIPINPAMLSNDKIIPSFINRREEGRILQLIDLHHIFPENVFESSELTGGQSSKENIQRHYSRFVAFTCGGQEYGLPVQNAREVTFLSNLNETFKSGMIAGDIKIRGKSVPVINSSDLFSGKNKDNKDEILCPEESRVLVFSADREDSVLTGLIVDSLIGILSIADEEILPLPGKEKDARSGIYQGDGTGKMILLNIEELLTARIDELKSVANIHSKIEAVGEQDDTISDKVSDSLIISQNSYLIVSIEKKFAFQLEDVQEIVESEDIFYIPEGQGYQGNVLNLRGDVLPVVNLREFYSYPEKDKSQEAGKLIICNSPGGLVAFEVDDIVTIYKQENYYKTPSLNSQLDSKRDTLDRLIEFGDDDGMEHVLVINIYNLFNNYLNSYKKEDGNEVFIDNPQNDREVRDNGV